MDSRMTLINRLKLQLQGHLNRGLKEHPETKTPLKYYAFKCDVHGIVEDYPHGHSKYLECPICREKRLKEFLESRPVIKK